MKWLMLVLLLSCRVENVSDIMGNANNNEEIADQTVEEVERVVTTPKVTDYVELKASADDQNEYRKTVVHLAIQPKGRAHANRIEGIRTTFDDIGGYNDPICDNAIVFESCGEYKDFTILKEGGFGEYVPAPPYKARAATIDYPVTMSKMDNDLKATIQLKLRDGTVIDAEPITIVSYPTPEESSRPDTTRANSQSGIKNNSYAGIEFLHDSQQNTVDGVARTLVRLTARKSISEGSKLHLKLPYRYAVESYEGEHVKKAKILSPNIGSVIGKIFGHYGFFIGENGFETLWFDGEKIIEFEFKKLQSGDEVQMYFALDLDNPRNSDGGQPRASFAPNGDFTGNGSKAFGNSYNHPITATLEGCTTNKLIELGHYFMNSQEKQENTGRLRLVDNIQLRQGVEHTIKIQNSFTFSTKGEFFVKVGANGMANGVAFGGNDSKRISSLTGRSPFLNDIWKFDSGNTKSIQTNRLDLTIKVKPKKSFKVTINRSWNDPQDQKLGEFVFKVAPRQSCWPLKYNK